MVEATTLQHDFIQIPVHANAAAGIQPKLKINQPGDRYEQEADRVAEAVMRMPDREADNSAAVAHNPPQRIYQECELETSRNELQGKGGGRENVNIDGHAVSNIQSLSGKGSPLPESQRAFFEPRFGDDFSSVRIHTDSRAAQLARSINARAFTFGRDVVFGAGEYSPGTQQGKKTLAHELTHVVQQRRIRPHIQRLTITQHALAKGTCGARNVQWVFSLDNAAPEDGYIVQQIDTYEYINTCPAVAFGPPAPTQTFWEAWFVKKGDKVDWTTVRDSWTDGNVRSPRPNTNGSDIAAGTIKFFKKSTTGDLGDFAKAPADPASAWGPGKVPNSGALPSTPSKPSWWSNTPIEGPAEREVLAQWNCCDTDKSKHTYNLTVKP
jgi:hypothetical protein